MKYQQAVEQAVFAIEQEIFEEVYSYLKSREGQQILERKITEHITNNFADIKNIDLGDKVPYDNTLKRIKEGKGLKKI